jgi:hypothetical protein
VSGANKDIFLYNGSAAFHIAVCPAGPAAVCLAFRFLLAGHTQLLNSLITHSVYVCTHSFTHSLTHCTHTHSLLSTHYSLHCYTVVTHSLTHALTHSRTHALTHFESFLPGVQLVKSLPSHPFTHSLTLLPQAYIHRSSYIVHR